MSSASRQASLAYRQALPPQLHRELSAQVCLRLDEAWASSQVFAPLKRPRVVAGFRGVRGEPDLTLFYERLLAQAQPGTEDTTDRLKLVFPRVLDDVRLNFYEVQSLGDPADWTAGAFGILEPNSDLPCVTPSEIDWFLVPGLLFSLRGARLGHGKGYYDRYLIQSPQAHRTGVAYDAQVVEALDQESHDVPMHSMVTQSRIWATTESG